MKKIKIVILSGSTGGGHVEAANSLQSFSKKFPSIQIYNIDVIKHMSSFFKTVYAAAYIDIVNKFPIIYQYLYNMTDHDKDSNILLSKMRYQLENIFTISIRHKIIKIKPDYIIFTHFLPAEHLNKTISQNKYAKKYAVVVTDFDVHWLWIQRHMDLFFVANEESADKLEVRGIDKEKIFITGIPIQPVFSETYNKKSIRKDLGLNPDLNTILFMSGASGVGRIDSLILEILKNIDKPFQILALTGTSKKLFNRVKKLETAYPGKIKAVSYTKKVYEYMAASDFAISKTGGLTTSECLAMGLPIISMNPIPGQEERNTHYLLENSVGLSAFDETGLIYRTKKLLEDKVLLAQMKKKALQIAKPNAGHDILKILLEKGTLQ